MELGSSPTKPREAKPSFTRRFRRFDLVLLSPFPNRSTYWKTHSMTPRSDTSGCSIEPSDIVKACACRRCWRLCTWTWRAISSPHLQRLEKDLGGDVLTRTCRFRSKPRSNEVPGQLPIVNLVYILLQIQREQAMRLYKVFTGMKNVSGEEKGTLSPKTLATKSAYVRFWKHWKAWLSGPRRNKLQEMPTT